MKRLCLLLALLATASLAQAQRVPVTTASDDARAQYVQGIRAMSNANFAAGRVHMEAALAADPSFAMAHMYRAAASAQGRDEHLRQATALGARASEGERQMVEAYAANLAGDHDREVTLLTALAARYPSDPMPMFIVANTEMNRDRPAEAVAAARRALAADPAFAGAYNQMGYAEVARGDLAAAEAAFRAYIRLAPDEANPYDSFGEMYLNAGRLDEAEAQFEMALTHDPTFQASRTNLVRIAITRAFQGYVDAINSHDAVAYAAYYTAGAVMSPPDGSQIVGRPAIYDGGVRSFAPGRNEVQAYETQEITPMGDGFVYHRATISTRTNGGTPDEGIDSFIWVKTPAGWQIARDTWTSNARVATASN